MDEINENNECIVIDGTWYLGHVNYYTAEAEILLPNACYLQCTGLDGEAQKKTLAKCIRNLGFTGEIVYA